MSQVVGWLAAVGLVVCVVAVLAQASLFSPSLEGPKMPVTAKLNSFKKCPDHLDVPSTYDDLTIYMDPENEHTLYVDGVLNMKETIPVGTKLIGDARKCYNEREESCEKYIIHEVDDICAYIPQEGTPWSGFVSQIEGMSKTCPIPAGSYKMNEAAIDLSSFQNQSEFMGHWQVEISFSNGIKLYGCMLLDITVELRKDGFSS